MTGPAAILFDRDDTLVADRPANRDPDLVRPMPGARAAVALARRAGLGTAVITNQPVLAGGQVTEAELAAVHRRVEALVGRVDVWCVCPHRRRAGCGCRKPAPGLVLQAADRLGVDPSACVVVGDVAADLGAARAAGALGVLVPTARTRPAEVRAAPLVARDVLAAVRLALAVGR